MQKVNCKIKTNVCNTRKNHARALDSMQASLEAEARAKAEALRIKKKLETVCLFHKKLLYL